MKRPTTKMFRLFAVFIILATLVGSQMVVFAQEPGEDERPPVLTATMKALLADQQSAWDRAPQAATPCVAGMAGSYPCENVDLLAYMPLSTFSASSGNDSWGWTDPLTGKEYALMGLNNGTAFVDITNPESPIYLGKLPTHTVSSSWRDIKVFDNHAFIVSEASNHGMQVFDLTELRNIASPPVTFSETAYYSGFGRAHNIVINEDSGYAYGVGSSTCSGGLHMVNIQTPSSPSFAGCFSADGYTHDAQCVNYVGPDPDHQGQEICFNANEDTLTIVDVTNKAAPLQVSRTGYSNAAYTHQLWTDETQTYLLLDDELDEQSYGYNTRTRVWDISNLDSPQLIGYYSGTTPAIDHNLYIKDGYAYEANYRAGLQILDLSDLANANLSQVGFFDIYPGNNNANFNGAWNVFPYFDSGVVIISGMEQGLFIVRPDLPQPCYDFNGSGAVDVGDISLVTAAWGTDNALYDFNHNGMVDADDITTIALSWDTSCTA
ncbi:MAG: choice-of-anchor B family protein [Caldilineae bacterium]|nr:choice-of-anchor B family protein [Caldilineae bacterium]